jgi:hypothetical protein
MARKKKVVPAAVQPVEQYLDGVAKSLAERIYGPDGMPWGTKLEELVDTVDAVRQMLSEKMLARILERQAASEQRPEPYVKCSGCGGAVDDKPDAEPRNVETRVGEAEWDEPHCYCRKCRRAFFPSEQESGDRSGRVQSGDARQDRVRRDDERVVRAGEQRLAEVG